MSVILCLSSALTGCSSKLDFKDATLSEGTVGKPYEQSIAVEGADGVIYSAEEGSLPEGLSLSADGVISGVPSAKGEKSFTVTATGESYNATSAEFSLNIKAGAVSFEDGTVEITVNEPSTQTLAFATDGVDIKYTIKSGTLPAGLSLAEDGKITGTATTVGSGSIVVTASAADCTSADATVTINVIYPKLAFEGQTLANGRAKEFYGAQLPSATGADNVTYTLKEGSTLPEGLTLTESGYIQGTPLERTTRLKFTVVASAEGYTSAEAEFTLTILAAAQVDDEGTISYTAKTIKTAYVGETYMASGAVKNASADNYASVTYELASDSSLPEGFVLSPNGDLRCDNGALTAGTFKFKVTASAEKCSSVTVEFTLVIEPAKLTFSGKTLESATVGTAYSANIAQASAPNSAAAQITYTVKSGNTLPAGLTLSADGVLTGTPEKSVKSARFSVTASAEGFTAADAYFYIRINEKVTVVTDGKFEAEYLNFDGFVGEGWSGTAMEEAVIQNSSPNASNGYYIGWALRENTYTFKFNSTTAVTGVSLNVGLGTEFGSATLTPSSFEIRVNGQSIDYGSFEITGIASTMSEITNYLVSDNVSLKEGENTIEIIIKDNKLLDGRLFGPCIDYVQLQNFGNAQLSWQPCTYNLDKFAD